MDIVDIVAELRIVRCEDGRMTALAEPLETPDADRSDTGGIALLTTAHVFNDANQSVVPALLAFLVAHHGFSLASAATLVLAMNLSSSIVQPLFGWLSDKRAMPWVIPLALLVASTSTALIGVAPDLPLMLLAALIAGIGVAAFHPDGARAASHFSGAKRGLGMGLFSVGGYGGFALGPILVTPLLLAFGLHGTLFLIAPGAIMAIVLACNMPRFDRANAHAHKHRTRAGVDDWRGFWLLATVVALRSTIFFASVTFLSFFTIAVLHGTPGQGAIVLDAMLLTGVGGTLLGGHLADRFDRRRIVGASLAISLLGAAALALAGAYAPSFPLIVVLSSLLGFGVSLSAGVIVVLGQEYLPHRVGVASGMTLGLAVTLGGVAAPVFGAIGDRYGMIAVFATVAGMALLSGALSLALPQVRPGNPSRAKAA
jgi:FSR family fosmidomycin resistance protein-like MFS transporter